MDRIRQIHGAQAQRSILCPIGALAQLLGPCIDMVAYSAQNLWLHLKNNRGFLIALRTSWEVRLTH